VAGDLKQLAGLEPTPPPPEQGALSGLSLASSVRRHHDDDESAAPGPMAPAEMHRPRAPRTAFAVLVVLLLAAIGAAVAIHVYFPAFFLGR
jgi:hypothetical protein